MVNMVRNHSELEAKLILSIIRSRSESCRTIFYRSEPYIKYISNSSIHLIDNFIKVIDTSHNYDY